MAGFNRVWGFALNNPVGERAPGATVTAYVSGTTTQIALYADAAGSQPVANPFTADDDAYYDFYAAPARIDLQFSGVGIDVPFTLGDVVQIPTYPNALFDLTAYGAVGDGVTDDTLAVQAAIDACAANGGGQVYAPQGNYLITSGLVVPVNNGIQIVGEGFKLSIFTAPLTSGNFLTVGDNTARTLGFQMYGFGVEMSGASGATTNGVVWTRCVNCAVDAVEILGTIGTDLGKGFVVSGDGDSTHNNYFGKLLQIRRDWTIGQSFEGWAGNVNTCNNNTIQTIVTRNTSKPNTGTKGISFDRYTGDNYCAMPNVEDYDTAYDIDGRNVTGFIRAEAYFTGLHYGANSSSNWLVGTLFSGAGETTVNDQGSFANTFIDHRSFMWQQTASELRFRIGNNIYDLTSVLEFKPGTTAGVERLAEIIFFNHGGTRLFDIQKTTGNVFQIRDRVNATARFLIRSAVNDSTDINSAGTAAVNLNRPTSGAGGGLGGVIGGAGTGVQTWFVTGPGDAVFNTVCGLRLTQAYSASMTPDIALGQFFRISVNNNTNFTINRPINPPASFVRALVIGIEIRNTSGGAIGVATWEGSPSGYAMGAAWTQPGSFKSRTIWFIWNGTYWEEVNRTAADVTVF